MNIFQKFLNLFRKKANPVEAATLTVADNSTNRENEFWKQQIGKKVTVIAAYGEFYDVQLEDQPVPNQSVFVQRFI